MNLGLEKALPAICQEARKDQNEAIPLDDNRLYSPQTSTVPHADVSSAGPGYHGAGFPI